MRTHFREKDNEVKILRDGLMQETENEKKALEERLQKAEETEAIGTLASGEAHNLNNILPSVHFPVLMDQAPS